MKTNYKQLAVGLLVFLCAACESAKEEVVQFNEKCSYVFHEKNKGENPKAGDLLVMRFCLLNHKGDTVSSTYPSGKVVERLLEVPTDHLGDTEGILMKVAAGDSLSITVNATAHMQFLRTAVPGSINMGDNSENDIKYIIKVLAIKKMEDKMREMFVEEEKILDRFLVENNTVANRFPSGLRVILEKAGTGDFANEGDSVVFRYKTMTLNGALVDEMTQKPAGIRVGDQNLIAGWRIAFEKVLKEGTVATLLIPSHLAFGPNSPEMTNAADGKGYKLMPYTVLICRMEIDKIIRQ